MYEYRATVTEVIDGDTLKMDIDLGFNVHVRHSVRLAGLDCPELSTPEGEAAKAFTENWVKASGPDLLLKTHKDREEKFGRYLAYVMVPGGAGTLNAALLASFHAVPYSGGKRRPPPAAGPEHYTG